MYRCVMCTDDTVTDAAAYYYELVGVDECKDTTVDGQKTADLDRIGLCFIFVFQALIVSVIDTYTVGLLNLLAMTSPFSYHASRIFRERSGKRRLIRDKSEVTEEDVKLRDVLREQNVQIYRKLLALCQELKLIVNPSVAQLDWLRL